MKVRTRFAPSPTGNVHIGNMLTWNYFQGLIDDVRIYDRALSQTEITEIAQ